jgi:GTP-binding protein YchF
MGLSLGIVGLPNVGKSTLFNALTKSQNAKAANYPFCTIEPNKATVPVPDDRLKELAKIVHPEQIIHATVDFYDIAGLVKGANQGEGLGNQFLTHIKETEAIVHLVRCFQDENVIHVEGAIDPMRDIQIIETELVLADLQTLENRLNRLQKQAKAEKDAKLLLEEAEQLRLHLNSGKPAANFPNKNSETMVQMYQELRFLTAKKVIYCSNVDEKGIKDDNDFVKLVQQYAKQQGAEFVKISAKMEEELGGLNEEESMEFLTSYGVKKSGLEQIIQKGYETLGLISYFTAGPKEVKAWTIHRGWKAPQAASVIHTDFERGFIRAEVIGYNDYMKYQGEQGAKAAGVLRVEGKEYVVQDGDVMHFRFNV